MLEPVDLESIDPDDHIWLPHRAVVKTDDQVTTKIRPVLNCSFKLGEYPSLNDAAHTGIDLLSSMVALLLMIRCNLNLVVGDIKRAFLQIKLSSDKDKNRFSILWQNPFGKLVAYRYSSLVFGLTSSPFILY